MRSWRRVFGFVLAAMIITLVLVGSQLWSANVPEVSAGLAADADTCPNSGTCGFIPLVFSNYSKPIGPPTPVPTMAVTPTPTLTPTPTATATATPTPEAPAITSFVADPPTVFLGESSTLNWTVTGDYQALTIYPDNIDVTNLSELVVTPTEDTTYTLVVTPIIGNPVSAQATVDIGTKIDFFSANPGTIDRGDSSILSWVVTGEYLSLTIQPGDIDVTALTELEVTPEETTQYTLLVTLPDSSTINKKTTVYIGVEGAEVVAFLWNKDIVGPESGDGNGDNGFPSESPVRQDSPREGANGDWTLDPNYAKGKLYYHWELRNMPAAHDVNAMFCMWQKYVFEDGTSEPFGVEWCTREYAKMNIDGTTVVEGWEYTDKLWKKLGRPMNWVEKRQQYGMVIKNKDLCPVTNLPLEGREIPGVCPVDESGILIDWAGEKPEEWYPMDMCLIVVAVGRVNSFSGWDNYLQYCDKEAPPPPPETIIVR